MEEKEYTVDEEELRNLGFSEEVIQEAVEDAKKGIHFVTAQDPFEHAPPKNSAWEDAFVTIVEFGCLSIAVWLLFGAIFYAIYFG